MGNVSIPRQPDVVTILSLRNPLHPNSPRTIVDAAVIGNARPCLRYLNQGQRLKCAKECLLKNGFDRVFEETIAGVYKLEVYVREN